MITMMILTTEIVIDYIMQIYWARVGRQNPRLSWDLQSRSLGSRLQIFEPMISTLSANHVRGIEF